MSTGYGFAAIIVAFVGRLNPIGIFFASLLMALLYLGGEQAQQYLNLPSSISKVFQGMLLFFLLGSDVFINYRVRVGAARAAAGPLGDDLMDTDHHADPRSRRSSPARRSSSRRWASSSPRSRAC